MEITKTKSSFYRRIFIALLIEKGFNTIPKIVTETGAPRRTIQDTINALVELDIICSFIGATKSGAFEINSWGPINREGVEVNCEIIKVRLGY